MGTRRRSRGEWAALCGALEGSGLSVRKFADEVGVHAGTLGWWRSRLRRLSPAVGTQLTARGFVEVVADAGSGARCERVVVRVGEVAVEFEGPPPPSWVAELAARC